MTRFKEAGNEAAFCDAQSAGMETTFWRLAREQPEQVAQDGRTDSALGGVARELIDGHVCRLVRFRRERVSSSKIRSDA
jgi:hypothetical protein